MKPVQTLALQVGYVEVASRALIMLVHQEGFDSVQAACVSIRAAILKDTERHNQSYEVQHGHLKPWGIRCDDLEDYLRQYHRSVFDDGFYDFEEYLGADGWLVLPNDLRFLDPKRLVLISSAETLIPKAGTWKCHDGDEWLEGEINTENFWLPASYDAASAADRRKLIVG